MSDLANPLDELTSPTATEGTAPEGQGQPTAEPSAVQPTEGQGQPGDSSGLYDLATVPEEYRSEVERIAKDIDRNVNAKLQEAAELRKSWEPFQEHGLHEYDPGALRAVVQLAEQLANPETAREALTTLAETFEIDLGSAPADPADEDPVAALQAKYDALEARFAAQDEQAQFDQVYEQELDRTRAEYAEVEKAHGQPFSEQEKARLVSLAKRFQPDHDEPIKAAYTFLNEVVGQAEVALVNGQPTQPVAAEPVGRASTTVRPVDTFEEAERLHRERNRTVNS